MGLKNDEDNETEVQISGCYKILSGTSPPQPTLIEHCCLMTPGNDWDIEVRCRSTLHDIQKGSKQRNNWRSLAEVYPEAKVEHKHNDIEVTLPSLQEDVEIAAFGRPGKDDQKRMQMAIFAKRPTQGRDWKIWVDLVDDINTACKKLCQEEDKRGNRLLTPLAGIFVSNSNEDITVELSSLEPGWKVKGSNVKTIKSSDAWNSLQGNSNDFPRCFFEISHVNTTRHSFFCGIKASHEGDNASAEVVAYFERESGQKIVQPSLKNFPKLSNTCNYVSKEINTWLPMVFFLLYVLFASDFNTTRFKVSNSTYQQFTTKKVLQHSTNSKPQQTSIRMPRSVALEKRGKAGRARQSTNYSSTVPQDHAHRATARKPNASERGNELHLYQKQRPQEVF